MTPVVLIGVDPGKNTGLAVYHLRKRVLEKVYPALSTTKAQLEVQRLQELYSSVLVVVEDARLRRMPKALQRPERTYGAGYVRALCAQWQDWLVLQKIPYRMTMPTGKKYNIDLFQRITGYRALTSQHGRDAGMLVYGT